MLISVTKGLVDSVSNNKTEIDPIQNDVEDEFLSECSFDNNMADNISEEGLIFVSAWFWIPIKC